MKKIKQLPIVIICKNCGEYVNYDKNLLPKEYTIKYSFCNEYCEKEFTTVTPITMIYNPLGLDFIKKEKDLVYVQGQPKRLDGYSLHELFVVGKIIDWNWFDKAIRPMMLVNEVEIKYI